MFTLHHAIDAEMYKSDGIFIISPQHFQSQLPSRSFQIIQEMPFSHSLKKKSILGATVQFNNSLADPWNRCLARLSQLWVFFSSCKYLLLLFNSNSTLLFSVISK